MEVGYNYRRDDTREINPPSQSYDLLIDLYLLNYPGEAAHPE
jgi:hypothetical protein